LQQILYSGALRQISHALLSSSARLQANRKGVDTMSKRSSNPTPLTSSGHDTILTSEHAAALLGFHPSYLAKARLSGAGPKYLKIGTRSVRYRRSDIDAWLAGKTRISTSDSGA
jgi:predicted DNA-binding transcriptional regulator AlpA